MQPNEQLSNSALIDKMFEDVLQAADKEVDIETEKCYVSCLSETHKEEEAGNERPKSPPKSPVLNSDGNQAIAQGANNAGSPNEEVENEEVFDDIELHSNSGENELEVKEESTAVSTEEDFLTLPPSILSPLSKSMEAVVTPLVKRHCGV